jgi:superfamily II DNA or RNA helicase
MIKQKKRLEKEKQREHAQRVGRHRRIEADTCAVLMLEAGIAWEDQDMEACHRLLEKVLRLRPHHAEALERLAEACFRLGRFAEGLAHYERLSEAPRWPPVTYDAAVAAWNTGRIEQCKKLLAEFLEETRGSKRFAQTRRAARGMARETERAIRSARPRETTGSPQGRLFARASAPGRQTPIPIVSAHSAAAATPGPGPKSAPIPKLELPAFPDVSVPEIRVDFEFERAAFERPSVAPAAEVFLRRDYALLKLQKGFDEMLSLGAVTNIEHFWYQIETVRRVLRDFRGRALLADEVGLGKTIEACFTLKEYWMRGLAKKALILTPPSLIGQWMEELASKFGMVPISPETGGYARDPETFWSRHDLVVASLALARQPANRERLTKIDYDLVIVDEAHYLKNRSTTVWQLVNELNKRFLLLLSATPIGNNLSELYNLILLLRPGLLGTESQFRRNYGQGPIRGARALEDSTRREKLRGLLTEVMVRNTRAHIDLKLPRRLAATEKVKPEAVEAEILEELAAFIHARYNSATPAERLRLTTLQMQAGSSPSALRYGLRGHDALDGAHPLQPLHAIADKLGCLHRSAKIAALVALARRSREKKVVFTRFLATLEELRQALESEGWNVSVFHGSLSQAEKEAAIAEFRERSEIVPGEFQIGPEFEAFFSCTQDWA